MKIRQIHFELKLYKYLYKSLIVQLPIFSGIGEEIFLTTSVLNKRSTAHV